MMLMKTTRCWTLLEAYKIAISAICLWASLVWTVQAQTDDSVCWKRIYGRGVGTLPGQCGPGQIKEGLLCVTACPTGFLGVLTQCHQICPQGFDAATAITPRCGKPAKFARNAYAGDVKGSAHCSADSAGRGCEQSGGLLFVKPPQGFACVGPLCQASCPAGMIDVGDACRKMEPIARGVGTLPQCGSGADPQLGMCYKNCNAGFEGAGRFVVGNALLRSLSIAARCAEKALSIAD